LLYLFSFLFWLSTMDSSSRMLFQTFILLISIRPSFENSIAYLKRVFIFLLNFNTISLSMIIKIHLFISLVKLYWQSLELSTHKSELASHTELLRKSINNKYKWETTQSTVWVEYIQDSQHSCYLKLTMSYLILNMIIKIRSSTWNNSGLIQLQILGPQ